MTLLGITGRIHSGKDTFVQTLVRHVGFARVAFADELKSEVAENLSITVEELERDKAKHRKLLQDHGMARRQEDHNHWITLVAAHIDWLADTYGVSCVAVSDVRFRNEATWVRARGGMLVRLIRADGEFAADTHESEAGQASIHVDMTFTCGSPGEVEATALWLLERRGW